MALETGQKLPDATIHQMVDGKITETSLLEWSSGRKVVLIALPGAFTPTCSARHLPGYVDHADEFAPKGVDAIGCIAVNDIHVMTAWGKTSGAEGKIDMLSDPFGAACHAMGIDVVSTPVLGNNRAARMALVAEDGVITQLYMEKPSAFQVSAAEHVLARL